MTDIPGGEGGFELGRAFVSVMPDASDFVQALDEEIGGLAVTVKVMPDASDFAAAVEEELGGLTATVKVTADTSEAVTQVDSFLEDVSSTSPVITLGVDTGDALGQVDAFVADAEAEIASIGDEPVVVSIIPDMGDFDDALAEGLGGGGTVSVAADGEEAVEGLAAAMDGLTGSTEGATEALDAFDGEMAGSGGAISTLSAEINELSSNLDGLAEGFGASIAGHLGALSGIGDELQTGLSKALANAGNDLEISVPVVPEMDSFATDVQDAANDLTISVVTVPEMGDFDNALSDADVGAISVSTLPDMSKFEEQAQGQADTMAVTLQVIPEMDEGDLAGAATGASGGLQTITAEYEDITSAAHKAEQAGAAAGAGMSAAAEEATGALTDTEQEMGSLFNETDLAAKEADFLSSKLGNIGKDADLTGTAAGLDDIGTAAENASGSAERITATITDLGESTEGAGTAVESLSNIITNNGALNEKWASQIEAAVAKADAMRGQVVGDEAAWQQFGTGVYSATQVADDALDDLNARYTANVAAAQQTAEAAAQVQEAAASEAADIANLQEKFADLSGSADELTSNIGGLYQQFATFASGTDLYSDQIANVGEDMETLGGRASEVESAFHEVDLAFESGQAEVGGLTAVYDTLSSAVGKLQGDLTQVSSAYTDAIAPMTDTQEVADRLGVSFQDAGTASAKMESNLRDVAQVSASMDALSGSATTVATAIDSDQRALQDFMGSLTLTESDVAALAAAQEAAAAKATEMAAAEDSAAEGMTAFQELTSGSMIAKMAEMFADPLTGLLALTAAIGVGGVEIADYENKHNDLIATLSKEDDATGGNIAGYQKLATQLSTTGSASTSLGSSSDALSAKITASSDSAGQFADKLQSVSAAQQQVTTATSQSTVATAATAIANQNATTSYESMHDGINNLATAIPAVTAAQKAAQQSATDLSSNLGSLEQQYGLTASQALELVSASGQSVTNLQGSGKAAQATMDAIEAYANANETALGPVDQLSDDVSTFANNALTASSRVNGLDDAYNLLVGNFVSAEQATLAVSQDFLTIASNAKQAGASMTGTNEASVTLQQSFFSTIPAIEQTANAMVKQGDSTSQVTGYINTQIDKLSGLAGGNQDAQTAVEGLKQWEDELKSSTDGMNASAQKAATTLENSFTSQVTSAGVQSSTAQGDIGALATAILGTGTSSTQTQTARDQLIKDLENAGTSAYNATQDVDGFIGKLAQIPGSTTVNLYERAQGVWTIQEALTGTAGIGGILPTPTGKATGGQVRGGSGTPRADDIPALLSDKEYVIQAPAVEKYGAGLFEGLNSMKYASGGLVGSSYSGTTASGLGDWVNSEYNANTTAFTTALEAAVPKQPGYAYGGLVQIPHFASGGSVWDATAAGAALGRETSNWAAIDNSVTQGLAINGTSMPYATGAAARNINVSFNGITSFPNPEQIQAIQLALSAAVGVS